MEKTSRAVTLIRLSWTEQGCLRQRWFTTHNKAMRHARRNGISDYAHFDEIEVPQSKLRLCDFIDRLFWFGELDPDDSE